MLTPDKSASGRRTRGNAVDARRWHLARIRSARSDRLQSFSARRFARFLNLQGALLDLDVDDGDRVAPEVRELHQAVTTTGRTWTATEVSLLHLPTVER